MTNFFHRLFNPHCSHCADELRDNKVCNSCEVLKTQLEAANYQINQLTQAWINKDKIVISPPSTEVLKLIMPRHVPWRVRQQELEAEDRKAAELMRAKTKEINIPPAEKKEENQSINVENVDRSKSIEELETELGVVDEL